MAINLSKLVKIYQGSWVALKADQKTVVSASKSLREAVSKAKKKGFTEPIMFKVPTKIIPYIGGFSHEV